MSRLPAGYAIRKTYIVICDRCNEDITRPQGGDDVETRAEAEALVREHQKTWHGEARPDSPADAAASSRAGWGPEDVRLNSRGGYDLSDAAVAEIRRASFGPDKP